MMCDSTLISKYYFTNLKKKLSSARISNLLYLFAISLYFFTLCFQNSEFTTVFTGIGSLFPYIYYSIIIILLFKFIFFTKFTISYLSLSIFFLLCGLLVYYFTHDNIILISFMFICSSKDIDIRKIAFVISRTIFFAVTFIFLSAVLDILPNRVTVRANSFAGLLKYRHYLGFLNVNVLGGFILVFCISYICFHYFELRMRHFFLLFLLSLFTLFYINSNTSALTILLIIFFYFFYSLFSTKKIKYIFSIGVALSSLAFSIFLPASNGFLFEKLNYILANRLAYSAYFLEHYSITLFGQQIKLVSTAEASSTGESPLVLDNSYLHCLMHYGLIVTIIFIVIYLFVINDAINTSNNIFLAVVTALLICSIFENWLYRVNAVIILFLFAKKFYTANAINRQDRSQR